MSVPNPTYQTRIETLYQKNKGLVSQIQALKDKPAWARFLGFKDDTFVERKMLVNGSELLTSWDPGDRILHFPEIRLKGVVPSRVKTLDQIQKANEIIYLDSKEMVSWLLVDMLNVYLEKAHDNLQTLSLFLGEMLALLEAKTEQDLEKEVEQFCETQKKLKARARALSTLTEHVLQLVSNDIATLNIRAQHFSNQCSNWSVARDVQGISDQLCFWQVRVLEPMANLGLYVTWEPNSAMNQKHPHLAQTRGFSLEQCDSQLHCQIWDGTGLRVISKLDQALGPEDDLMVILNCPGRTLTLKFRTMVFQVQLPEGTFYPLLALKWGSILYNK